MSQTSNKSLGIVLISYCPSVERLYSNLECLSEDRFLKVFIIDSSPLETSELIRNYLLNFKKEKSLSFNFIHIKNVGVGFALNYGAFLAFSNGCELVTIVDDDAKIIVYPFPTTDVIQFFRKNCNPEKDLLVLPNIHPTDRKTEFWVETGLTFSKNLFSKIKFREEFILDQIDSVFCKQVLSQGGKILLYPKQLFESSPVGRISEGGINHLPNWRLYTLTRNSVAFALETSINPVDLIYSLALIFQWTSKSIRSERRLFVIIKCVYFGILDGLLGNLGITRHLQELSGHRFEN